ncbi:hypothetical protein SDC9_190733 [bioreactor metagenome]|uniref:Uncharacterized protein n=1 Tax=bioreactor metagenome TaxID=1076179 RepID=A0A645I432_9ZZZZ
MRGQFAVAPDFHRNFVVSLVEDVERAAGSVFTEESDAGGQHHRQQNPGAFEPAAGRRRQQRGQHQDQNQRLGELAAQQPPGRFSRRRQKHVGAMRRQAGGNLRHAQSGVMLHAFFPAGCFLLQYHSCQQTIIGEAR